MLERFCADLITAMKTLVRSDIDVGSQTPIQVISKVLDGVQSQPKARSGGSIPFGDETVTSFMVNHGKVRIEV